MYKYTSRAMRIAIDTCCEIIYQFVKYIKTYNTYTIIMCMGDTMPIELSIFALFILTYTVYEIYAYNCINDNIY